MTWKLKVDDNDNPVFEEKNGVKCPVYIDPDGTELALDPPSMYDKIQDMGRQNQKDRKNYTEARDKLKPFEGIDDLEDWKKTAEEALATVKNLKDKDLMDADKVANLKREINEAWDEKLRQKDAAISDIEKSHAAALEAKDSKIRTLLVSNKFAQSKFFNGKDSITVLPADIAEDHFGKHFKVEEDGGTMVLRAYYDAGHTDLIRSKTNPGEPATFDEAIGFIIDKHPRKEGLLRGSAGGSGGGGGNGGGGDNDQSEVKKLEKQLKAAQDAKDVQAMVAIKNRLHEARKKEARR